MWDINKLAIIGDTGDPIATPFVCLYKVRLKVKSAEFKYSLKDFILKLMLNGHLLDIVWSFSSKPLKY